MGGWETASRRRVHVVLDQAGLGKYILLLVLKLHHVVLFFLILAVGSGSFQIVIEEICKLIGMILNFLPNNCPLRLGLLR